MFAAIRPARLLAALPLLAAIIWAAGCGGGKGKTDSVSGKVTLDGKPVAGEITFICSDGKEFKSPLTQDGGYSIIAPPKGVAKIGVKGMLLGLGGTLKKADSKGGESLATGPGSSGVAPPAKYADPAKSGLTYDIKGGSETHDIALSP
jgi:hypothetical protein